MEKGVKMHLQTTVKTQSFWLERGEREHSSAIPLRSRTRKNTVGECETKHQRDIKEEGEEEEENYVENRVKYLVWRPNRWSTVKHKEVL